MVDVTQVGTAPKLKKNKNIVWLIYYLCQLCAPTLLGKLALINLPYFSVQLQESVCPAYWVTFMGLWKFLELITYLELTEKENKSAICQSKHHNYFNSKTHEKHLFWFIFWRLLYRSSTQGTMRQNQGTSTLSVVVHTATVFEINYNKSKWILIRICCNYILWCFFSN